jgi:hypothetical protein
MIDETPSFECSGGAEERAAARLNGGCIEQSTSIFFCTAQAGYGSGATGQSPHGGIRTGLCNGFCVQRACVGDDCILRNSVNALRVA